MSRVVFLMQVTWYGGTCVFLEKRSRGVAPRGLLFFPQTKTSRVRTLEDRAQVIVSHERFAKAPGNAFFISGPGEYDVASFAVRGVFLKRGSFVYVVESEGIAFCLVNASISGILQDRELEAVGAVDVVSMPVVNAADVGALREFVQAVEPRIVVPLAEEAKVRTLLAKEFGVNGEGVLKLTVSEKDFPEEGFRVTFLDPQ